LEVTPIAQLLYDDSGVPNNLEDIYVESRGQKVCGPGTQKFSGGVGAWATIVSPFIKGIL
jgi:hypothetical protein